MIVVGTIATTGDPNVLVMDDSGNLRGKHVVGQRWISQVSLHGREFPFAVCTMPEGRADDVPTIFACGDSATAVSSGLTQSAYVQTIFHYGEHSNHAGDRKSVV